MDRILFALLEPAVRLNREISRRRRTMSTTQMQYGPELRGSSRGAIVRLYQPRLPRPSGAGLRCLDQARADAALARLRRAGRSSRPTPIRGLAGSTAWWCAGRRNPGRRTTTGRGDERFLGSLSRRASRTRWCGSPGRADWAPGEESVVTVRLSDAEDGGTLMDFTHDKFLTPQSANGSQPWAGASAFNKLATVC